MQGGKFKSLLLGRFKTTKKCIHALAVGSFASDKFCFVLF